MSRIGIIEPGMIGIVKPLRMAPLRMALKRDFEGFQECCFLLDFASTFSLFSDMGLGLRKLLPLNGALRQGFDRLRSARLQFAAKIGRLGM